MKNQSPSPLPFALLLFFVAGCTFHAFGGSDPTPKRRALKFQVDAGPLEVPARWAAQEWSKALGRDITVSNDAGIPIFFTEETECGGGLERVYVGCSLGISTVDARIEVRSDTPPEYLSVVLLHEMGHHLHGDNKHIKGPANAVLLVAPDLKTLSATPHPLTVEDIAFVCENFDCAAINV